MAYNTQAKLFASDLSNYSEIRRGLSPAMRKATPTLKELKSVDAATQQGLINALNDWRRQGQAQKIQASQLATGIGTVFSSAAKSPYYSNEDKITLYTAGIKIKMKDPDVVEWDIRENLSANDRLRNQDFYKAKYYYDGNEWDPTLATNSMLTSFIEGGGLVSASPDIIEKTFAELTRRFGGNSEEEQAQQMAGYHNEIMNIAKLFMI